MSQIKRSPGETFWKIFLGTLFAVFTIAMVLTFVVAGQHVNSTVDHTYGNGLATGVAAGWAITATASEDELRADVRDRGGAPVTGGTAKFFPLAAGEAEMVLAETTPGRYGISWPSNAGRESRGVLHFRKGDMVQQQKVAVTFP